MLIAALAFTSCDNQNETNDNPEAEAENQTVQPKRLLLVVDPQIDFTTGSLAVGGGPQAMETLAAALRGNVLEPYGFIAVTQDFHPADHSSFVDNGGTWPPHCVQGTEGVEVYPALQEALDSLDIDVEYLHKGDLAEKEEYSIFQNTENGTRLKAIAERDDICGIDICGIASDYCVFETLKDLLLFYPTEKVRVVTNCVAAVSDNEKLSAFMEEHHIEAVQF